MAQPTSAAASGATASAVDDPDGLSFFTSGSSSRAPQTVFGLPTADPLDRVFGDSPLPAGDELGTADLSVTASGEQVMSDISGRLSDKGSTAWCRAFILYGPPAPAAAVTHPRTSSILGRLRRRTGDGA